MKKTIALLLAAALLLPTFTAAAAYDTDRAAAAANAAVKAVKPENFTLGCEWLLIADCTSFCCELDAGSREQYYNSITTLLEVNEGSLGTSRMTEYERAVITLSAMGYSAENVGGYNLLLRLADYNAVKKQGINSVIFALLALDSGCYDMPEVSGTGEQNSRKKMVDNILSREIEGGGFALYGKVADVDITAMAIQALAKYTYRTDVEGAVERAVENLSRQQLADGSFPSLSGKADEGTAESTAQVLLALSALGISPDDPRFTKNKSIMDALLDFQLEDGSFVHIKGDEEGDYAASVQAINAICAIERTVEDGIPAYVFDKPENPRFSDVVYNDYRFEIEALAEAAVIDGMSENQFAPDNTMTRAQFAAIVIRALGMEQKKVDIFEDVSSDKWYAGVVGAAYSAGIIQGRSDTVFDPEGTITDAEAFVMLSRAAGVSGINTGEYAWYASDYSITRGEVAEAVYKLYSALK